VITSTGWLRAGRCCSCWPKVARDEAILREAKRGYDLIVLRVSQRPEGVMQHGYIDTRPLGHVKSVRGELNSD
jgi:hypothetical protein